MADINKLVPRILRWEGGYVNDPNDAGHATNKGVTIATWRTLGWDKDNDGDIDDDDVKLITTEDFKFILKVAYWDKWRADSITNQSIAELLVDWVWGSGVWGIIIPQRILGVTADGKVGIQTITAVNNADPKTLYEKLHSARLRYIDDIVASHPEWKKFKKGWENRINDYFYSTV